MCAINPAKQHAGNRVAERTCAGIEHALRCFGIADGKKTGWRAGLREIVEEDTLLATEFEIVSALHFIQRGGVVRQGLI